MELNDVDKRMDREGGVTEEEKQRKNWSKLGFGKIQNFHDSIVHEDPIRNYLSNSKESIFLIVRRFQISTNLVSKIPIFINPIYT